MPPEEDERTADAGRQTPQENYIPANRLFAGWESSDGALCVEFAKPLLEEIRKESVIALHGAGRGGVEIAGLLFGTRSEGLIRILRWAPLHCHYTQGPVFALDVREQAALACRLDAERVSAAREGMMIAGWFVSRRGAAMRGGDPAAQIHRKFFSGEGQLLFAVSPQRFGEAEVSVYRLDNETQELAHVPPAFYIDPAVQAFAEEAQGRTRGTDALSTRPGAERRSRRAKIAASLAAGLLLSLAAVGILWSRVVASIRPPAAEHPPIELLSLHARAGEGELRISWNPRSEAVLSADRGRLLVRAGEHSIAINLTREDLLAGEVSYPSLPESAEVTLEMANRDGGVIREICNYRGDSSAALKPSPVPPSMRPPAPR